MKTTRILLLLSTFLLFPWSATSLFSQQDGVKKVVITKRTVEADGTESSETIVKKGTAAENFDLDKYLRENRSDNVQLEIQVTGGEEERSIVIKGNKSTPGREERKKGAKQEPGYPGYEGYEGFKGLNPFGDNSAFLGVEEDSDERADQPGLVVQVLRGSAAELAGLRHNDKIMKINDTPINQWSDLTQFVRSSKVGDKVRIDYERNGKPATTEAILKARTTELKIDLKTEPKGFLGVSDEEGRNENNAPGVAVSVSEGTAAAKAGLQDGDVIFLLDEAPILDFEDISDFMNYTKPGQVVKITFERKGKRNTVEATLTAPKNTWEINTSTWDLGDWSPEELLDRAGLNEGNCTVNVRAKDACLGVYSDASGTANTEGSLISDFTEESAAREVNMAKGDIIISVDGQRVKNHDELWNEISKHKVGDKVNVEFVREGKTMTAEATLKPCRDNSSKVQIIDGDGTQVRNFTSWNWSDADQRRLRERSIITIRKGEGDGQMMNAAPGGPPGAQDRSLNLTQFRVFPNPTPGQVTVEFRCEPVATTVSFFDLSGRQLFREELNAFGGQYSQQFDLSDYAKGTILVHVQQGDKVYTEQVVVQ